MKTRFYLGFIGVALVASVVLAGQAAHRLTTSAREIAKPAVLQTQTPAQDLDGEDPTLEEELDAQAAEGVGGQEAPPPDLDLDTELQEPEDTALPEEEAPETPPAEAPEEGEEGEMAEDVEGEEEEEEPTFDPAEAAARIEALEAQIEELREAQAASEEQIEELREQLAAQEEWAEVLDDSREERIANLEQGVADLQAAEQRLAAGDVGMDSSLAAIEQAFASAADEAAQFANPEEARLAAEAANAARAARQALARNDLYAARMALGIARAQAQAARAAALSQQRALPP